MAQFVGAVGAPVYTASSARDAAYVLEHSDAVGVLVEGEEERAKVAGVGLDHVLTFGDLDALRARGRDFAAAHPTALDEAADAIGEDDLFTFIFTSGTTGRPKACMITHRNYYEMSSVVDKLGAVVRPDDVMLLYLPLAHNFGRLMHLVAAYGGFTLAPLQDPLRAAEALVEVRPTVFPSVPRLLEPFIPYLLQRWADGCKKRSSTHPRNRTTRGQTAPKERGLRHALALAFSLHRGEWVTPNSS